MKPQICPFHASLLHSTVSSGTAAFCLLVTGATLVGCSTTTRDLGSIIHAGPTLTDRARADLGIVGVVTPSAAAPITIDKASGQIDYPADRAGLVARDILSFQPIGHPQLDAVVAVADAAVAPFAASAAAVSATKRKLSTEQLDACEQRVTQALTEAVDQARLTEKIMQVAAESGRRQLVPLDQTRLAQTRVDTVFDSRIEEIRLERTGPSDASFALRVKARVRLTDATSTKVIYDEPFEYLSGTALFLDWSMEDVLASVADTARNELAENIVGHLFSTPVDGPILLGAGFKRPSQKTAIEFASGRNSDSSGDRRAGVRSSGFRPALDRAAVIPIDYRFANSGAIGIYSTSTLAHITVQRPLTKDEAVIEALDDLKYDFDGLDEFPNIVVQLGVCAAAIPLSLYRQTAAAFEGVSARKLAKADAAMTAALQETRPHEELAQQVAQCLAPQSMQTVKLVQRPLSSADLPQSASMQCVARGTLAGLSRFQDPNQYLLAQGAENALELEVIRASLEGKGGANAPLSLCVEARVLLFHSRDGRPIYSSPVKYLGAEHRFLEWAAHDARLYREEVANCYHQMGSAIASELISHRIVLPRAAKPPEIAGE